MRQSISSFIRDKIKDYDIYDGRFTLQKLRELATTHVSRECVGNWNYRLKRERFGIGRFMKRQKGKECFVCNCNSNLHRHHIIPLKNGGVSIKENIVGVCVPCHSKIHGFGVGQFYQN